MLPKGFEGTGVAQQTRHKGDKELGAQHHRQFVNCGHPRTNPGLRRPQNRSPQAPRTPTIRQLQMPKRGSRITKASGPAPRSTSTMGIGGSSTAKIKAQIQDHQKIRTSIAVHKHQEYQSGSMLLESPG